MYCTDKFLSTVVYLHVGTDFDGTRTSWRCSNWLCLFGSDDGNNNGWSLIQSSPVFHFHNCIEGKSIRGYCLLFLSPRWHEYGYPRLVPCQYTPSRRALLVTSHCQFRGDGALRRPFHARRRYSPLQVCSRFATRGNSQYF